MINTNSLCFNSTDQVSKKNILIKYDIRLCVVEFKETYQRKILRNIIHGLFYKEVFSECDKREIKRGKFRNSLRLILENDIKIISYSFSYVKSAAIYGYSYLYDVAIDLVEPSKIEGLFLSFFKIPDAIYAMYESYEFGIKTISWGIQEVISKLERTGLMVKYTILDECHVDLEGNKQIMYVDTENRSYMCNIYIINERGKCIVIAYRKRQ